MAASNKPSADIQFLITFALGMGAFWLSGKLPGLLPAVIFTNNLLVAYIISLIIALTVYGGVLALWLFIALGQGRSRRAVLVPTAVVVALALMSSLVLSKFGPALSQTQTQFAILIFVLYLAYGLYYVGAWSIGRRLAK